MVNFLLRNLINKTITVLMSVVMIVTPAIVTTADAASVSNENYKWSIAAPLTAPSPRTAPSMAYDEERHQLVLFGGWTPTGRLNDTWIWDGVTWTQVATDPLKTPPPRSGGAMVYDSANQQIILFGGAGMGPAYNDTWIWDGSEWSIIDPFISPSPRSEPQMAYDAKRGEVVLFGGNEDGGSAVLLNDTWVWSNAENTWKLKSPATSPENRFFGHMAYDPNSEQVVLFGGKAPSSYLNDTWTWDGSDWTRQLTSTTPQARLGAGMVYDGRHLVLFGGEATGGMSIGDVWFWDSGAGNWIPQPHLNRPDGQGHIGMAYDTDRKQIIAFGGGKRVGGLTNETSILQEVPMVSTEGASAITRTTAALAGNVTYEARSNVTERGIVVSKSANPTVTDMKISDSSSGLGMFEVVANGLETGTQYHYRAYAVNGQSTEYGMDQTFTTVGLSSIRLDQPQYQLHKNQTLPTVVTAVYTDGSEDVLTTGVTFLSTDPTVAEVNSQTGEISAKLPGITTITAQYLGREAYADVTVMDPPVVTPVINGLHITPETLTIEEGASTTVNVTATYTDISTVDVNSFVNWSYSNPGVAQIENGTVNALNAGTTVATATYQGQTAELSVTVSLRSIVDDGEDDDNAGGGTPGLPGTPETPSTPSTPGTPETPSTPSTPGTPSTGTTTGGSTPKPEPVETDPQPKPVVSPFVSSVIPDVNKLAAAIKDMMKANKDVKVDVFQDVATHWNYSDILLASRLHIIKGYPDGTLQPDSSVTRAEFASMIARAFKLTSGIPAKTSFTDINDANWAKSDIEMLASLGVLNGYKDGTFKPGKSITRAEMIAVISRIISLKDLSKTAEVPSFQDIHSSYWAKDIIGAAASAGIIEGMGNDKFLPDSNGTRAESLSLIIRALRTDEIINDFLK